MKEALKAVLDYLFVQEDYQRSYEETDSENLASRKLLESFGFQLSEIKKEVYVAKVDKTIDVAAYELSKEEYLAHSNKTI